MRVALVSEYYYPHLGGVTEHVHNLALQLHRLGHGAIVITSNMAGQEKAEPFVRRVGKSRLFFSNGSFSRFTTGWQIRQQIEEIFHEEQIDVVHLHGALTLGLVALKAAKRMGVPVVATFHSWFPRAMTVRLFHRPLQKSMDYVSAKIAVSEPVVQAHARYFKAEWEIIPNGVDVGYFHPNGRMVTEAFSLGPRLLFLGRLDPRNGLNTVLEAMPDVLKFFPKTRLWIAGDGPLRNYYESQARSLRHTVLFLGYVFENRPFFYGSSDLYLCPTTRASFGITLLEAMACGTPMIVSDIIGFRELVNEGEEAVLAPPRDSKAWAKAAVELIGNPERRAAMRLAGLRKAAEFSWPRIAERVVKVYERILR